MMMVVFGCYGLLAQQHPENNNNFFKKREAFKKKKWSLLFVPSSPLLLFTIIDMGWALKSLRL
jgi:hypothetical protein